MILDLLCVAQALLLDELKNVSYTTIETYRIGDTPTNITNTDLDGYRWPPRVQVHRPCLSAVEMGLFRLVANVL